MKHYLITGGAGFIGSNLIKTLFSREEGARVSCVDNFDPFYSAGIKQLNIRDLKGNPNFHFISLDLASTSGQQLLELIPPNVDVIIHLAAKAGVRPSIQNPLAYQQVNVIGLQNLLEFARLSSVRQFVFASSSSVYGVNDHYPWKEDEKLLPVSPYAMTKQAGEMLGHVYHKLYGIRFIALRIFTAFGPAQRPDLAIHKFIKAIEEGKPITMYGDGSSSRDYTYVDDLVNGILSASQYTGSGFEIINLGNNYCISLNELIKVIEEVTGKKAIIERLPEQPGDVPKTFADISKANRLLGYQPKTHLREGIAAFYKWYKTNLDVLQES